VPQGAGERVGVQNLDQTGSLRDPRRRKHERGKDTMLLLPGHIDTRSLPLQDPESATLEKELLAETDPPTGDTLLG